MDDKIKLIAVFAGGFVVTFLLSIGVFWVVLSPGKQSAAQTVGQDMPQGESAQAAAQAPGSSGGRGERVPGGEVMAYADVLGENIPLEAQVRGYDCANWGMSLEDVLARLKQDGIASPVVYQPPATQITSLVALNPDSKRYKVEYRFYNNQLFYVEVYYSDFYKSNSFNAFLLSKMSEYGRPYEQYATVDEMGNVVLHAKWDTEESLVELVARPGGQYSLFLSNQMTLIQLEEARKSEERLAF